MSHSGESFQSFCIIACAFAFFVGIFVFSYNKGIADYKQETGAVTCICTNSYINPTDNAVTLVFLDIDNNKIYEVETRNQKDITEYTQKNVNVHSLQYRQTFFIIFDLVNMQYSSPNYVMHDAVNITCRDYIHTEQ